MILQNVLMLETIFPCWAYALNRIGRKDLLRLNWLNKTMPKLLHDFTEYKWTDMEQGDILIWKHDSIDKTYQPVLMEDNQIICQKLEYANHVCVYEGNKIVSEMVTPEGNATLPFIIRKRKLEQLSTPDFIIPLRNICS